MRKYFLLTALLLMAATLACHAKNKPAARQSSLRVMTWNIRQCTGMDNKIDYDRTARAIVAAKPDVVALQEVDSATTRHSGRYVAGELASRTGMNDIFGPAINALGGKYGVALLTKEKPKKVWQRPLPGKEEKRTLLVADMGSYVVASTHLSLTEADRIASIAIIHEALSQYKGKPCLLMGDFNATPSEAFFKEFSKYFTVLSDSTVFTFPADVPNRTLDYVTCLQNSRRITVESRQVLDEPVASDHRPIFMVVKWNNKGNKRRR